MRCTFFWSVLSAVAIGAAGCSSDTSRFGENAYGNSNGNPYGSPYAARPPSNQLSAAPMQPAHVAAVERQPLPQAPSAQSQYAPPQYAPSQYATPQYERPQYAQPPYAAPAPRTAPDLTGAVRPGDNWDRESGAAVVVAPGDTVDAIARRFRVPAQDLMQANNITNPAALTPGQRLVIPRYVVNSTGAKLAHAAAPRTPVSAAIPPAPVPAGGQRAPVTTASPVAAPAPAQFATPLPASGGSAQTLLPPPPVHTVTSGDTLGRVAHKYRVKVKDLAVANGIQPETPLKVGMQLTIPVKLVATPPNVQPGRPQPGAPAVAQTKASVAVAPRAPAAPAPGKLAVSETPANVRMASPVETSAEDVNPNGLNGAPAFRWPTRGRVINNFGAKVNGSTNDGIDLAVPEGTQVRAADDGVVAYAGNELKGYGNLVLVRHSNGFVTAYANASELLVKRNDQVHKGQVILKSGQTGNAANPQLHFEIRKNSAPVDPMQFLPTDKTASAPL